MALLGRVRISPSREGSPPTFLDVPFEKHRHLFHFNFRFFARACPGVQIQLNQPWGYRPAERPCARRAQETFTRARISEGIHGLRLSSNPCTATNIRQPWRPFVADC